MTRPLLAPIGLLALAVLSVSSPVRATEAEPAEPHEHEAHSGHEGQAAHGEHDFHRHHIGLIIGGASTAEESRGDTTGFTAGLDYEYRFNRWVGVGPVAEVATGDLREAAFVGTFFFHPWRGLLFAVGPGVEISSHGNEYLTRLALGYQFPIGSRFTIAPDFSVDIVNREAVFVYGVAFGIGF